MFYSNLVLHMISNHAEQEDWPMWAFQKESYRLCYDVYKAPKVGFREITYHLPE